LRVDRDGFWGLVEDARASVDDTVADPDGVADALTKVLAAAEAEEIAGFGVELARLLVESYRWDLWAAAYLINSGASEDGFDSFRGWLIAQGREAQDRWRRTLPCSLASRSVPMLPGPMIAASTLPVIANSWCGCVSKTVTCSTTEREVE